MTISPFLIYLWGQADKIISAVGGVSAALLIFGAIGFILSTCMPKNQWASDEQYDLIFKTSRKLLIAAFSCLFIWFMIPDSKTIATMVVVPAIVNSQPIQKDLPDVYNLAVDQLKSKIKESSNLEKK